MMMTMEDKILGKIEDIVRQFKAELEVVSDYKTGTSQTLYIQKMFDFDSLAIIDIEFNVGGFEFMNVKALSDGKTRALYSNKKSMDEVFDKIKTLIDYAIRLIKK